MSSITLGVLLWSWTLAQSADSPVLGAQFENRLLHIRGQTPTGWRLVSDGSSADQPLEFWKEGRAGPRIQIASVPYPLSDDSEIDDVQEELARALIAKFPDLRVGQKRTLLHQGHPAIEVTATLPVEDTFYHVIQRSLFARGKILIITCAAFESSFIGELPVFRAFLESVEILDEDFGLGPALHHPPLLTPPLVALLSLGIFVVGLLLRRVSAARLNQVNR